MPKASPTNKNVSEWKVWVNSGFGGQHLVPLPKGEKGPKGLDARGWQDAKWTRGELEGFALAEKDIGLRTKHFPTLDIDADDPEVVGVVLSVVAHDEAIMRKRTGTARCAVIFKGEPNPKALRTYELDGQKVGIEILGEGQQVKVAGTHPDGSEYYVEGMREAGYVQRLDLTPGELLDRIESALVERFGDRLKIKKKSVGGGLATGSHQSREVERGTREQIKEVLDGMPNTAEKFDDYNDVINRVLAPIYGASDGADWGFDLWKEWAQSGDYEGENSDDWVLDKWQSVESTGSRSGLNELRGTARDLGEAGASARSSFGVGRTDVDAQMVEQGQTPDDGKREENDKAVAEVEINREVVGQGVTEPNPFNRAKYWLPAKLKELRPTKAFTLTRAVKLLYYDESGETVYRRSDNASLGKVGSGFAGADRNLFMEFNEDTALKSVVPVPNQPGQTKEVKKSIREYLMGSTELFRVNGITYEPGGAEFVRIDRKMVRNEWLPTEEVRDALLAVAAAGAPPSRWKELDQTPVYDLVMAFFEGSGDPKWKELAELFLDWMALVICAPHIKPSIHFFLASEGQGTGKSTLAKVIKELVGYANSVDLSENNVTGQFQDHLENRFVHVDEAAGVMQDATGRLNRTVYSRIKANTQTGGGGYVTINPKGKSPRKVANLTAWLILSNHNAEQLGLEADDRRFVVIESDVDRTVTEDAARRVHNGLDRNGAAARVFLARAFARRLWDMWNDAARWNAVTVDRAPDTATKQAQRAIPMSAVASTVRDMLDEGLLTSITTLADVKQTIAGRRGASSSVVNAVASDRLLGKELGEMGAVKLGQKRIGPNGEKKSTWALPTAELDAPDPAVLDQAELKRQRGAWKRKMRAMNEGELKKYYSRGV